MIPIGSRIISGFIGRNLEKLNIILIFILIFILKTPIRQFIMECLIGVFAENSKN